MTPDSPSSSPSPPAGVLSVTELIDRLGQQRDLYEQLKVLSAQQAGLIADGQTEQLLSVLSQRQYLVERIGELNTEIAPCRQRWPELSRTLDASQRQHVNGLLEQVESLLQAIVEQDDRDRQQLSSARQQVAGELEQVRQGSRAINAYKASPAASAAARYTDRRG